MGKEEHRSKGAFCNEKDFYCGLCFPLPYSMRGIITGNDSLFMKQGMDTNERDLTQKAFFFFRTIAHYNKNVMVINQFLATYIIP